MGRHAKRTMVRFSFRQCQGKSRPFPRPALHGQGSPLALYDGSCQRKAQANPIFAALRSPVEAPENIVNIFLVNARPIVGNKDPDGFRKFFPGHRDMPLAICMIQRIFNQISQGFAGPLKVAVYPDIFIPVKQNLFLLLPGPHQKLGKGS